MKRVLCCLILAIAGAAGADGQPADPAADPVIAIVNGEEVHAGLLAQGVPKNLFGMMRQRAKAARLQSLVERTALRQRLTALGAKATDDAVAAGVEALVRQPPLLPCFCHAYADFADYMLQNRYTRDDVALDVWIDLALQDRVDAAWAVAYPTAAAQADLLAKDGPAIRTACRKLWHLAIQLTPMERNDLSQHQGPAWGKVSTALQRLRAGEDFAVVARELSDNPFVVRSGGYIGPTALDDLGNYGLSREQLDSVPAGTLSEPLADINAYHLIRWEAMTDADILAVLKQRFGERLRADIAAWVKEHLHAEYLGEGKALAASRAER